MRWASYVVGEAQSRAKTLVQRIMKVNSTSPLIQSNVSFGEITTGLETWTEITESTCFNAQCLEGLDAPKWRETTNLDTGAVIESRCIEGLSDLEGLIPSVGRGPQKIKTTVWYGSKIQARDKGKVRTKKTLMKGIRRGAALFLLEAMVLLAAGSQWSGSWTQRLYGTGVADVWEVFGDHGVLSNLAFLQGWRTLEPLQTASFGDDTFHKYVDDTLETATPRLVVIESPGKIWNSSNVVHMNGNNSDRNRKKNYRKVVQPFFAAAVDVATKQLAHGHDFVLEVPLSLTGYSDQVLNDFLENPGIVSRAGRSSVSDYYTGRHKVRSTWWMSSSDLYLQDASTTCRSKGTAQAVLKGLRQSLRGKEPERLHSLARTLDARIRAAGVFADENMTALLYDLKCDSSPWVVHSVVREGKEIPEDGIEFDIPPDLHSKVTKSLLSSLRRLHFNTGHPPNTELARVIRLSGGSDLAAQCAKGIKCSICAKSLPPKSPKPGKIRDNIGEFNAVVMGDLGYVRDATGQTHGYLILVDEGTDWCVAKYIGMGKNVKTAGQLYDYLEEGWINWAGPPDMFVADNERGFSAEEFVTKLGRAGTFYQPAAAYAAWQKGKVERKIESFKAIVRKSVLHSGVRGTEMKIAGIEAAASLNQRPGPTGVSPAMMLFGQRLKLYGELYANGEPTTHPEGGDTSTVLGRRLQIRNSVRQATEAHYAKELVRKAVSSRTRQVSNTSVGEFVYFYRRYPSQKAVKLQAQRGCYLGPGVIIGTQGQNCWVSYAGRCYLVAPEHLRGLAPEEVSTLKPLLRHGLEQLKKAAKSDDYLDLTRTTPGITQEELEAALNAPAGDDPEVDANMVPPETEGHVVPSGPEPEEPLGVLLPEPIEVDEDLTKMVEEHTQAPPQQASSAASSGVPDLKRDIETGQSTDAGAATSSASSEGARPVTWQPAGDNTNLRWSKKPKTEGPGFQVAPRGGKDQSQVVLYGQKCSGTLTACNLVDKYTHLYFVYMS